jgi:hypothetical protein
MTDEPEKLSYKQCVIKKSKETYKKVLLIVGVGVLGLAVAIAALLTIPFGIKVFGDGLTIIFSTLPPVLSIIPWYGYVIGFAIAAPTIYSMVWCYFKRSEPVKEFSYFKEGKL